MRGQKLSNEQRSLLAQTYREHGYEAAKAMATEYGVSPSYPSMLARQRGHFVKKVVSEIRQSRSAMWKRAIENGALVR